MPRPYERGRGTGAGRVRDGGGMTPVMVVMVPMAGCIRTVAI
ncbi:hypothetical protein [Microbispora triticiradicis]|nr:MULTISPECIES: hypothetical protein [Microbispora]